MPDAIIDGTGSGHALKINQDGSLNTNSSMATIQSQSGNAIFLARAEPGANTGSPSWQMSKQLNTTFNGLSAIITTWASGNGNFDKKADDLFTSPYS